MNNDRIANTPGGERMLGGGIVFGLAFLAYQGLKYELGDIGTVIILFAMVMGAVQFGRGLYQWKYADRKAFEAQRHTQHLYIDIPLRDQDLTLLHEVEDAVIERIRDSKSVSIELHSVDTANDMGTIHLIGREADAMFAFVYSAIAPYALPDGLRIFPRQGQAIDTEIHGKRVMMSLPSLEVARR